MSAVKIVDDVFWVGVQDFDLRIFDIVMVVTCISVLVQGSTLKFMAGHLKVLKEE